MSDGRPRRPDRAPSVWSGALYYGAFYFAVAAYMPFLYVHFVDLGLSGKQVGLLATLPPIVTMVLSTVLGSIADRTHTRVRIAQTGLVCFAVTIFLFRFPTRFATIVPLMVSLSIFVTPFTSIADGLVARMANRNHFNFGGMRLWGSFGFAISAIACGFLWEGLGYKTMFLIAALLFVPSIVIVSFLEEGPRVPARERTPASHLVRDPGLLLLLLAAFLSGIGGSLSGTFSGIYARWLGGGDLLVGGIFAISALAELPTMFLSDRISSRFTETNALVCSYAVMAAAFVGCALTRSAVVLLVLFAVKGLGYGMWLTGTIRSVTKRTSEHWASTAQALLTMCMMGLAPLVAGPVGGLIYDAVSPAAVFMLAAGALTLAGGVVFAADRRGSLA